MLADVTFTVDITPQEAQMIRAVIEGKNDAEITKMRGCSLATFMGWCHAMTVMFELVKHTREGQLSWSFREASDAVSDKKA